jgi:hypothetical protein
MKAQRPKFKQPPITKPQAIQTAVVTEADWSFELELSLNFEL